MRDLQQFKFVNEEKLSQAGLTAEMIATGIQHTYGILDIIDSQLVASGSFRLAEMVELNNLSSIIGNLLGAGIAKGSRGNFQRSGPHQYPDLLAQTPESANVEIKIAIETNKPKGHLAKAGYYLTFRYVLGDEKGLHIRQHRGNVVWVWEVRFGWLNNEHFSISNTPGDSGKTATINTEGMKQLAVVFCDLERCPYAPSGATYRAYAQLYSLPLL
jgi:hypothetical protein